MSSNSFTCVHDEGLVVAKQPRGVLFELAQDVVVEGPGGQGQDLRLLVQRIQNLGVTVALVHGYEQEQKS